MSSQNSANSVEGAVEIIQSACRQSWSLVLNPSYSCKCIKKLLLCLYLHFVPFWLQAAELNDKLSSTFTILVETTVNFCPQLMYRVFCVWGMFHWILLCLGQFVFPPCLKRV